MGRSVDDEEEEERPRRRASFAQVERQLAGRARRAAGRPIDWLDSDDPRTVGPPSSEDAPQGLGGRRGEFSLGAKS
jgi:hypothetical protein